MVFRHPAHMGARKALFTDSGGSHWRLDIVQQIPVAEVAVQAICSDTES